MDYLDVDVNLSREEIARLGETRPFWKFVTFPINVKSMIDGIGPKPKPLKFYLEKDKMNGKNKETYISPFSGRVM